MTGTPVATVGRNPSTGQVEIIDILLRLGQALDEQNIPETGRWVVMPTWATFQIKRSELREVFVSGDSVSILRNGKFGQIDRFTIYASNLLPNGVAAGLAAGEWVIFAGHAHGLTFASQLTNVETIRSERTFGANPARSASLWPSGLGRQGDRAGHRDAGGRNVAFACWRCVASC